MELLHICIQNRALVGVRFYLSSGAERPHIPPQNRALAWKVLPLSVKIEPWHGTLSHLYSNFSSSVERHILKIESDIKGPGLFTQSQALAWNAIPVKG